MYFDGYNYVVNSYDFSQHKHHLNILKEGIFIDVAPLFILVVGHYDKVNNTSFIENFKSKDVGSKNRTYKSYDYNYLLAFLNSCGLGTRYKLCITPHVFTEFVKHLWDSVHDSDIFKQIIKDCFKTKWYIVEENISFKDIINMEDFLNKKLEIGDISLTILCNEKGNKLRTVLTDDEKFMSIADKKHDFLTILYQQIRIATQNSGGSGNIDSKLLQEPIEIK